MLLRRTSTLARRANSGASGIVIGIRAEAPRRRRHGRAAASPDPNQAYPYQSGEGRNKATIEHIFSPGSDEDDQEEADADADADAAVANNANADADAQGAAASTAASTAQRRHRRSALGALEPDQGQVAPWGIGWQMSERNIVWNDDLKLRLIKHAAATKLGLHPHELERRLALLAPLLPRSLGPLLARASADTCVRLADNASVVAARLLRLKALFPLADVEAMISERLSLLLDEDLDDVAAARAALAGRVLVGPTCVCVDRFVEAFPVVLSARGREFERAVDDAFRLLPSLQRYAGGVRDPEGAAALSLLLRQDPDKVVGLMKGSCLITYDQVSNPFTPAGGMAVNPPGTPG